MRDAAVYGVGSSYFGKQPATSVYALAWQACQEAFADAGVDRVDAAFVGTALGSLGTAHRLLKGLGVVDGPVVSVENACASGTTAYHEAYEAVRYGRYNRVLALGVEQMTARVSGAMSPDPIDPEGRSGIVMLPRYGMMAQRYMAQYGVPIEDIAYVAVKNSRNGALNKRAQRARELSLDEVLRSRPVADPLTLFQSCSISDGAAAAILGPARDHPHDIAVKSSALIPGGLWDYRTDKLLGSEIIERAADAALGHAGCTIQDIDVFEVHDAFTIGEVLAIEALGLAEPGAGPELGRSGATAIDGRYPVNPSGGLLSRGHPLGATGLAQLAEIVWQLRGEADSRQVAGATLGLVETAGGGVSGIDGTGCVVTVLSSSHGGRRS
jgi:acetyl-CoA acetyltransferase